jgi:hypothetical protein
MIEHSEGFSFSNHKVEFLSQASFVPMWNVILINLDVLHYCIVACLSQGLEGLFSWRCYTRVSNFLLGLKTNVNTLIEIFSVVNFLLLLQDSVITNPTIALVSPKPQNSSLFLYVCYSCDRRK